MTEDEHALKLGLLIANLQALEAELRVAIAEHGGTPELDLRALQVGDRVPVDGITSYWSLERRIRAFNQFAAKADRLDRRYLKGLRDQLAHGLTVAFQPQPPLRLFKFGPDRDWRRIFCIWRMSRVRRTVPVDAIIEMSESWFAEQREKVAASRLKVKRYIKS